MSQLYSIRTCPPAVAAPVRQAGQAVRCIFWAVGQAQKDAAAIPHAVAERAVMHYKLFFVPVRIKTTPTIYSQGGLLLNRAYFLSTSFLSLAWY